LVVLQKIHLSLDVIARRFRVCPCQITLAEADRVKRSRNGWSKKRGQARKLAVTSHEQREDDPAWYDLSDPAGGADGPVVPGCGIQAIPLSFNPKTTGTGNGTGDDGYTIYLQLVTVYVSACPDGLVLGLQQLAAVQFFDTEITHDYTESIRSDRPSEENPVCFTRSYQVAEIHRFLAVS